MRRALPGLISAVVLASGVWLSPTAFAAPAPSTIDTLLGRSIDDSPLLVAHQPFSVTVGVAGRLYIADPVHHVVRFVHQVPCDGFCVDEDVFAGNEAMGTGGDKGDATKAQLAGPYAVAEDPQTQDVYIADTYGHQIRKVTEPPAGSAQPRIISTIAGTGAFGFSGDGSGAANAQLNSPNGIAFWRNPSGRHQTVLYVADTLNNRIRVVYLAGTSADGSIATVAGSGAAGDGGDNGPALSARLNAPRGLAVDPTSGALFIADTFNNRVRRFDPVFDPATGAVSTASTISPVAGTGKQGNTGDGGAATAAQLNSPAGVAVAQIGLLVADTGNHEIRAVAGGTISRFAGTGTAGSPTKDGTAPGSTPLSSPFGVAAVPPPGPGGSPPPNSNVGSVFIADTGNNIVRIVGFIGSGGAGVARYAGNGTPGLATINFLQDLALDGATAVVQDGSTAPQRVRWVLDSFNHSIRLQRGGDGSVGDPPLIGNGRPGSTADGPVTSDGTQQLHLPLGIALVPPPPGVEFGPTTIYVADTFNNRVRRITVDVDEGVSIATVAGTGSPGFSGDNGPAASAQLSFPTGLAVDTKGNLFIADTYNARIRQVDTAGNITTVAGTGTLGPDPDAFNGPATKARLSFPLGLAADPAGDLFIADSFADRVRRVDATTHTITTIAGAGSVKLNRPWGLAFDGFGPPGTPGTLLISDFLDHVVRALDLRTGSFTTLAGTGAPGFSGDPGAPGGARLDGPRGVMVAPDVEEILIGDSFSNRIRILGSPSFSGPTTVVLNVDRTTPFPNTSVNISNGGTGILELGSVTLSPIDPGFFIGIGCTSTRLAAGQPCQQFVEYDLTQPVPIGRPAEATMIVHDVTAGVDHPIALEARIPAIGPVADITFPTTDQGFPSAPVVRTITNPGSGPLNVSSLTFGGANAGDFSVGSPGASANPRCSATPFTLLPGARCDIGVIFTPGGVGARTGTLTIADNVPGGDTKINLSGTGVPHLT